MRLINKQKLMEEAAKNKSESDIINNLNSTPEEKETEKKETKDNNYTHSTPNSSILDQDRECQNIIKLKDYYDILGIDKNSEENEIKRAYKKVSIKIKLLL